MADKYNSAFETAYDALNKPQKEAVDTIEGPVMVIAGPGTGKTQVLTLRIANILRQTDIAPENVLALTFTEAGARAMRARLRSYLGSSAHRVAIHTFHGFCERIIGQYPEAYKAIIGGRLVTDVEKFEAIESILSDAKINKLRPAGNPTYYIRDIMKTLSDLKQEYVTPDRLREWIRADETELANMDRVHDKGAHKGKVRGEYRKKEEAIAKNHELLFVYRAYEAFCRDEYLYDYADMIASTVTALTENTDLLLDLQETYQYLLADEHQDVNGSQNLILERLASYHDDPNIFVVGDEKQAIFRFQGASLSNFLYFKDLYKNTKVISLEQNYRSGQRILDASQALVAVGEGPLRELRIPLKAEKTWPGEPTLSSFPSEIVEDDWVVKTVKEAIESGTSASEISIVVRTNSEVEQLTELLRASGLPAEASAESNILEHPIMAAVSDLVEATIAPENETALASILHGAYWGFSDSDLIRLFRHRGRDKSLRALLEEGDEESTLGLKNSATLKKVVTVLKEARRRQVSEPPQRVLAFLIEASGLLEQVVKQSRNESLRVLRRLYDECESLARGGQIVNLADFWRDLNLKKAHGLPLNAPFLRLEPEAVSVQTAHKAKGLEYEMVIIPHLTDANWGGRVKRRSFNLPLLEPGAELGSVEDDERRLLYVAMTRAKKILKLAYSDVNLAGRPSLVSRLLDDQVEEQLVNEVGEQTKFDPVRPLHGAEAWQASDISLLRQHLSEHGLSPTALNNYLKSPWNYFYRNVLRIPEPQSLTLQFGTAVHGVLEEVVKSFVVRKVWPKDSEVKSWLDRALGGLPLSAVEYTRQHEKALVALTVYLEHLQFTLSTGVESRTETSLKIRLPIDQPELPELMLTGKLDRLDFSKEGKLLRVTDYKTGKPKTRRVILGETATSNGDYWRQLVFYALLLDGQENTAWHCREMAISFVEPDKHGQVREELFTISDKEIADLKEKIRQVAKEIANGTFLREPCDPKQSDYCHLLQRRLQ